MGCTASSVGASSADGTVKEMFEIPPTPASCTIMSTVMLARAIALKIALLVPGLSGTPLSVIRASSMVTAAPLTPRVGSSETVEMIVPVVSSWLLRT